MRAVLTILMLVGLGASAVTYYTKHLAPAPSASFCTVVIKRGDLQSTIGATGTVQPEEVVDVGAQVAGLILEFGPDAKTPNKLIDYGSIVEKDTVLAKIDPTSYQAAFDQAEANLERAKADLQQLEAKLEQTEQEWQRAESLRPLKAVADTEYDSAKANYRAAKANLAVGKATVRQNEASLRMAKTNLGYTVIRSPVRGVIIARRVNAGQTVVASLNAPSLFLIAKDLRRMQVWASVNEADIGRIHVDMPARFTVDAHPGETFRGTVCQIRMNATMTQNVVTYTVVVTTDNSSGRLLPYLTANVQFEIDQRTGVLLAPNAALRWKPQPSQIVASADSAGPRPDEATSLEQGRLWLEAGEGRVRPLEVRVGLTDGLVTEVIGTGVSEGLRVVSGEETAQEREPDDASEADKTTGSPFLPKPPKGARPPGPPPM